MNTVPKSPLEQTKGMAYFPRMLSKIRLFHAAQLRSDFHSNLGRGADQWCTHYLRVSYEALREQVLSGQTDEELLDWCFNNGRALDEFDIKVWNHFIGKLGWNDEATPRLRKYKQEAGLAGRDDLVTMIQFMEVDEGRMS